VPRLELLSVTPQVLCVCRARYLSASYIVHDEQGVVLVDAGMEADGSDMLRGLEALGARSADIRAILLTHWHNDHSSGAEALREASGARVYHHALEAPNFERSAVGPLRRRFADLLPEHGPLSALKALVGQSPPRAIRGATRLSGGETIEGRFQVLHTPGHSAGHVSFLYLPGRVLFAGDALAVCGERLWFLSRFLTEDRPRARASMRAVASIDAAAICPGHRGPLNERVAERRRELLAVLDSGRPWPWIS
jgi:glyoxylase-like metal-dependent hydrolase (beta-lactamase superfamily II)